MVRPEHGRELILEQLRSADPWATCLDLNQAWTNYARHGAVLPKEPFADLAEPFLAGQPSTLLLARAAIAVPGLWNRTIAGEIFLRLEKEGPSIFTRTPVEDPLGYLADGVDIDGVLALLDLTDRERLTRLLRDWARTQEGREQEFAVRQLLWLGDPESGPMLLEWVKAHPDAGPNDNRDSEPRFELARSPCPEVEAFLLEGLRSSEGFTRYEFARALLEVRGAPRWLDNWSDSDLLSDEQLELLATKPPAELLESLLFDEESGRFEFPDGLGLWRDPMVVTFLKGLLDQPHLVSIPALTGQLAAAGDERARREMWSAIRVGRYRWICYENEYDGLTLGYDPQTYPFLLYDTEGNCCRGGHVARMFEHMIGRDHLARTSHGGVRHIGCKAWPG